jgi:hypothetical protein
MDMEEEKNPYEALIDKEIQSQAQAPSVVQKEPTQSGSPTTRQEWEAAQKAAATVKEAATNLPYSEISPRQAAYIPGALLGMRSPSLFDPLAWQEASIRQRQRKENIRLANEQLKAGQPVEVRGRPVARTGTGAERYAHAMSSEIPEAMAVEAKHMGRGTAGATDIIEENVRREALAKKLQPGWELQGENVPSKVKPSFQLALPPGTLEAPAVQAPPAAAKPSIRQSLKGLASTGLEAGKTLLNYPMVKGALHGANIAGNVVQILEDLYHRDPAGFAITMGQLGLGATGPVGALAGIGLGEGARYLRKHTDVLLDPLFRQQSKTLFPENYSSE